MKSKNPITPLRDIESWPMTRPWDEMFQRFFGPNLVERPEMGWNPRVDIKETPQAFEFTAEMPGLKPEDVHISVTKDSITISGEKRTEEKKEEDNWVRTERTYGSFQRAFTFPTPVDPDAVKAEADNGILMVEVKKAHAAVPRRVTIKKK